MDMPVFGRVREELEQRGLRIVEEDLERPWGGFYAVDERQLEEFIRAYFPRIELPPPGQLPPMRPKILMVAPGRRLSWQYHHRRSEEWHILQGPVGVARNHGDEEVEPEVLEPGDVLSTPRGIRHRLVGLAGWGVVAELWVHADPADPSTEDDIVRVSDDFKRAA